MSLSFRNKADLIHWLESTQPGREVLQETKPGKISRVLVKAHSDGWIEVYGPWNIYAKIIALPSSLQREAEQEQYVEASLPYNYKELYCPGNLIVTEQLTPGIGYHQFMQRETNTTLDLALVEGCNRVQGLQPSRDRDAGDQGSGERSPLPA